MQELETQKHLQPKFSEFCSELIDWIGDNKRNDDERQLGKLNVDLDFHILNDCMAYDNTRQEKSFCRSRATPMITKSPISRLGTVKSARREFDNFDKVRASAKGFSPNLRNSNIIKGVSLDRRKKGRKVSPAQRYHDQAMALLTADL